MSRKTGTNSRRKRRALSPNHCEVCGYSIAIQRHRIVPGRDGGEYKIGNVISLCPNCHIEADRDILAAEFLQYIVKQRLKHSYVEEG